MVRDRHVSSLSPAAMIEMVVVAVIVVVVEVIVVPIITKIRYNNNNHN
jgi:heme/copper-type cytochrome/quinol oxidase subunit 2